VATTAPPALSVAENARDLQLGLLGTGVAVTMWGLSGVIIKSIDMDAMAVGFWRFLIYAAIMSSYLAVRGHRPSLRMLRKSWWGGMSLGFDIVFFFTAVKLTTIVNATTIGSLQPLVVAVFACWASYFVFSKRSRGVITSTEYTAGTGFWTTIVAGIAGVAVGQDMSFPASSEWFPLLVLVLGTGVLGHSVMNWSLVRIPLWLGSTLTLLIPVVSSVAAWIWLGEPLTWIQITAMTVVIAALATIVMNQRAPEPVRAPQAATT
jgi:drug/metabolite transporter (DMT)-like permease